MGLFDPDVGRHPVRSHRHQQRLHGADRVGRRSESGLGCCGWLQRPGRLVADDDRVGRRVRAAQQQCVGGARRGDEQVDRFHGIADRANVDFALVAVALQHDLTGRIDRRTDAAAGCCAAHARRGGKGRRRAAMTRMDVAEHVGDRRPVDADAGRLLDRHDGFDRHAVDGLDDLQRVGGHRRQGEDGGRCGDCGTHRPSVPKHKDEPMRGSGLGWFSCRHWAPP